MKKYLLLSLLFIVVLALTPACVLAQDRVSSYSFLGSYVNVFDLYAMGLEPLDATVWRMHTSDITDNFIWLDDSAKIIIEGTVFYNLDPSITHDTIADYIVSEIDKGFVTKLTKCYDGTLGICKTIYESLKNFITTSMLK